VRKKEKTKEELVKELRDHATGLEVCELEREEAQEARKKSEDDVRALLNATTDIVFLMGKSGDILAANESAGKAYHAPPGELIGKRVYDLLPPALRELGMSKAAEAIQTGEPVRFEAEWRGKYLDHSLYVILDEQGQVARIAVYVRDVTRRKQMEAMVREAEEKYRKIYENATEGIFQATTDGRFISVNPSFARIHGFESPEEVVRTITDIGRQLWAEPERRTEMVRLLTTQGWVENFEAQMRRRDGSLHWISINARAVRDAAGKLLYHEGTMRDISKRKEAEQALGESEERYRTAIEHSNDGVALIRDGIHQYVNRRFVSMFGYDSPDEIVGTPVTIVVHPDDRERVLTMNRRRSRGEAVPSRYEFKGITRDGQPIFIEVSATSITYKGDSVLLVYLRDVTERKRAEETLLRSHKELEQLNWAKSKVVNHVSHELKTPIAVIQGNVRLLRRKIELGQLDPNSTGIIDALERNIERLLRIQRETDEIFRMSQELEASALLDELDLLRQRFDDFSAVPPEVWSHWGALKEWLSRYTSGSEESYQLIDLYSFAQAVVERVRKRAGSRRVEIRIEGVPDLYIFMDPLIVSEVMEGLLRNAVENTPDGGFITAALEEKEDRVWLHITDTGIGITEESQRYIFDGLFPARETELYASKKPYEFGAGGKGLDLLRMRIYAQRFGFEISMKSRRCCYIPADQDVCPGDIDKCSFCKTAQDCVDSGGSTFSVSFPAEKRSEERAQIS
jgi:PAS domain S-box-containing protein